MAKTLEDLQVFQRARAGAFAISAILKRPVFLSDRTLRDQMDRASVGVVSNIAEGFGTKSDAHFARFLLDARGSAEELRVQLEIAADRERMSPAECQALRAQYAEICRMLSGLIRHLRQSNWTDRRR